ncbi:hypothetical protein RSSM_00017 [Rhodopirellula sallentina SM41]|uniref:Uncharacterized protein n=1 Tax=Rhodopirellula sallentina SM41 TaxID=1263870 RepID=M5UAN9_9BACT|nr:hypothetical protein RSSM_00017 [Rhodopirellula sallentina SM41]
MIDSADRVLTPKVLKPRRVDPERMQQRTIERVPYSGKDNRGGL